MGIKLILTVGLPGSGKSTFAKKWVEQDPTKRVRVNRDDIRRMLGPYIVNTREKLVTQIEDDMIIAALSAGYSVIVDATNFRGPQRFEALLIKNHLQEVSIDTQNFTHVPLETCLERDKNREHSCGESVIMGMYNKYLSNAKA